MSNRMKLEVDPSIIEKNLDFRVDKSEDDPLSRLFPNSETKDEEDIPWILVRPKPGFVLKYRTLEGDKVFVNVCHCNEVPEPPDITGKELIEILESDELPSFAIPISIGDLHVESDKSNNLASAYDVVINTKFFEKLQDNEFKNFAISVITQGIENKHNIELDKENQIVILKNKKCFGTIEPHRIQQRPVRTAAQLAENKLIQELPGSGSTGKPKKKLIEELKSVPIQENSSKSTDRSQSNETNELVNVKLIKIPKEGPAESLVAFITISALSGKELELDVGEDRIMVNSPRKNEMVDFFLPYRVNRDKVRAKYLVNAQTLRVELTVA